LGLAQLSPGIGGHLALVVLCGLLDVRECLFPLFIGGIAHLVEAGDGIPEVADVAERFLSLLREGEGELKGYPEIKRLELSSFLDILTVFELWLWIRFIGI
jgi:hypothetical protein